jgi:oxygen-dependent protoporphyrinogen oxidase
VTRPSVVVVGGGVSGLAAAWELSGGADGPNDATPRVEVIEADERCGGSLATTTFAGRTIDLGADGFLARRPEAVALVRELGLEDDLEAIGASGAWLYLQGALRELPPGLVLGVPTELDSIVHLGGLTRRSRLAARRDTYFPRRISLSDDATIGEIVRTKLGRELAYQLVEPMIGGIQAGRIDELSSRSVFPALLDAAKKGGSLMRALRDSGPASPGPASDVVRDVPAFYSLRHGVGSLATELVSQLSVRGVVIRTGVTVTALRRTPAGDYPWEVDTAHTTTPANAIVLATAAPVAGALLSNVDPALDALRRIPSASTAMITFAFARSEITLPDRGTGVLVPLGTTWTGEGSMMVTAITLLDRKWPRYLRDDDVLLRAHVGRSDDARASALADDDIVQRVRAELAQLLPRVGNPTATLVQRWPQGLPQYLLGHEQRVSDARAAGARHSVALAGNAYDGVGIPASIGSGRTAARTVLALLEASSRVR